MGAFCVFGMTRQMANKLATDAEAKRKLTRQERAALTEEDVRQWIAEKAEELFSDAKARQVSPAFDAPQFANDWIDLAKRTDQAKRCRVMVRGAKVDKKGAPSISKRTGKPVMTWLPYKEMR
jgi:hypothetical protein